MKLIVVLSVTLAVFASSIADEEKRTKALAFYKCLACNEDHEPIQDLMKCTENGPDTVAEMMEHCKEEVMPDAKTLEERKKRICDNEGVAGKLYDCIKDPKNNALFEEHKHEMKEFKECAIKVHVKHCSGETKKE